MLEEISWEEFREWQQFLHLDPPAEDRLAPLFASVVQALWNIARDVEKHPNGWPLSDFLIRFGDDKPPVVEKPVQTTEYQEHILDAWFTVNNLIVEAKSQRLQ